MRALFAPLRENQIQFPPGKTPRSPSRGRFTIGFRQAMGFGGLFTVHCRLLTAHIFLLTDLSIAISDATAVGACV